MEKDETEGGDAFAYYFWAIAIFFFTLALLNFIVLLIIAHVLEISPSGMEAIEFMPGQGSVKFLKHLIAPVTTIGSGLISGFAKEPMNIVAENGDIVFQVELYHLTASNKKRESLLKKFVKPFVLSVLSRSAHQTPNFTNP